MTFYLFIMAKDGMSYDIPSFTNIRQGAHHGTNHQ
jgi:hypothetical protein